MDHAIYTAMGAASQTLNQQAVTASNLANASTPGFRAQLNALRAVPVEGLSLHTRTLVTASTPGADMTPGQMDYTARPLDVALQQDGWLAVQTADGAEGYTRNGNIQVSATGQLTIQGHPVMGEAGPLTVPEGSELTIAADGTISALNPGDPANTVAPVGRLKLVKAEGNEVQRGDDGMFRLTQAAQATRGATLQADPTIRVMSGVLEGSNVKPVEAMTIMFGAFSLVNGAFNLFAAVRHIQKKERWGWLLFSGIVGILTGVVVLVAPWAATIVLASFLWASVGFWAIFTGVLEISAAVRLRQEIKGEIWLALSGLLSIILGAIVLWIFFTRPVESFVAAGWLLGFHAAVYGVTLLFLSWSLRKTRLG